MTIPPVRVHPQPDAGLIFSETKVCVSRLAKKIIATTTGLPLEWEVVSGEEARRRGHPRASLEGRYIKVTLARAVPGGGEVRIRIDKTYWDHESYFVEGDEIVFDRSLGIQRNAVVLPAGYELVGVNHPSQVVVEEDGRIRLEFWDDEPDGVDAFVKVLRRRR